MSQNHRQSNKIMKRVKGANSLQQIHRAAQPIGTRPVCVRFVRV